MTLDQRIREIEKQAKRQCLVPLPTCVVLSFSQARAQRESARESVRTAPARTCKQLLARMGNEDACSPRQADLFGP